MTTGQSSASPNRFAWPQTPTGKTLPENWTSTFVSAKKMAMRKYSISISGHRTSYSLEPEFYAELEKIAEAGKIPLARLITRIDDARQEDTNLSSALRLYVLNHVKSAPA